MLVKTESNGDLIATPSTSLQYLLLIVKNDYLTFDVKKLRKSC